jgi:protocatechuate 3,4-dioxygenase beta subunit
MAIVNDEERTVRTMERRITRRQALGAAGSTGAALLVSRGALSALGELVAAAPAAATNAAVAVTPTMTEGPYWIDEMLRRFDVRANTASASASAGAAQAGVPLALKINVLDAAGGGAINGAHVDIWHANANGLYSDEGGQQGGSTAGQNFLRGYQVTGVDAGPLAAPVDGQVNFKTIWPGWYSGRAIHIHVRVRTYDGSAVATNYTTQIFFSDADNDSVMSGAAPYNTRSPKFDPTTDETDNILASSSARSTNVVPVSGSIVDGFAATFTIGLSGVASNATADTKALTASIVSARVTKAANGNRTVVVSVKTGGAATAHASLSRDGKTLSKATGQLTAGTHSLRMAVGKGIAAGAATVKLTFADSSETLTRTRKVNVPA